LSVSHIREHAMKSLAIIILITVALSACSDGGSDSYQVINKEPDGKISIINQKTGRLTVINKSNRIEDVVELDVGSSEIEKIKSAKEKQDAALKIKDWGEAKITGTKYKVSLATRYYKDKLLYRFTFSPSDQTSAMKARKTTINLRDENGFVLEKINPSLSWSTSVNEKGVPELESANGEIPMTLDNYLEISAYDPLWSFR